jgi:hypothetical protein
MAESGGGETVFYARALQNWKSKDKGYPSVINLYISLFDFSITRGLTQFPPVIYLFIFLLRVTVLAQFS